MDHRTLGYTLLAGNGIEIGALHNPAKLPTCCHVTYCDAMSAEDARRSFPELVEVPLVNVSHLVNLDTDALSAFGDATLDFVVINHVIEHVANPIRVILDCFRVLTYGGKLAISAPDMRFTFDRNRALTTPEHLWREYEQGVTEVSDEHYAEFLRAVHPEVVDNPALFESALLSVRDRREHAHVWSSETFQYFLKDLLSSQSIEAQPLFENLADRNHAEYFSVWQKGLGPSIGELVLFNPQDSAQTTSFLLDGIADMNSATHVLRESVAAADSKAQELKSEIAAQEALLHSTAKACAEQAHVAELALRDKQQHIENIEAQLAHVRHAVIEQSNSLAAMEQSRSWRWTRPLRRR